MKVEMGIMEAKFESSQRSLEADLQSKMEKEVRSIIWLLYFDCKFRFFGYCHINYKFIRGEASIAKNLKKHSPFKNF